MHVLHYITFLGYYWLKFFYMYGIEKIVYLFLNKYIHSIHIVLRLRYRGSLNYYRDTLTRVSARSVNNGLIFVLQVVLNVAHFVVRGLEESISDDSTLFDPEIIILK